MNMGDVECVADEYFADICRWLQQAHKFIHINNIITFSAEAALTATSASTSSASLEATANSFSLTASSLLNSFTDSVASNNFFKPD